MCASELLANLAEKHLEDLLKAYPDETNPAVMLGHLEESLELACNAKCTATHLGQRALSQMCTNAINARRKEESTCGKDCETCATAFAPCAGFSPNSTMSFAT